MHTPDTSTANHPERPTAEGGSRVGSNNRLMSAYEVNRLLEEHTPPRWDDQPVDDATLDDLDQDLLGPFLARQRRTRPRTFDRGDAIAFERLRITKDGTPTLAAVMVFGHYPQQFFPRLAVKFCHYPGTAEAADTAKLRMLDNQLLTGPIPEIAHNAVALVQARSANASIIQGMFRQDVPDYPLLAVREAIVNALMHRDYSPEGCGSPVQVNLFADRLEITSPGGLYGAVTLAGLGNGYEVSTRNQRIATFLEVVKWPDGDGSIAENRGTGFPTMEAELARALMPPVKVLSSLTSFTVTFERRLIATGETHAPARDVIVALLGSAPSLSTKELMDKSGLSRTTVQKALNVLIADNLVERTKPLRSPNQRYRLRS